MRGFRSQVLCVSLFDSTAPSILSVHLYLVPSLSRLQHDKLFSHYLENIQPVVWGVVIELSLRHGAYVAAVLVLIKVSRADFEPGKLDVKNCCGSHQRRVGIRIRTARLPPPRELSRLEWRPTAPPHIGDSLLPLSVQASNEARW